MPNAPEFLSHGPAVFAVGTSSVPVQGRSGPGRISHRIRIGIIVQAWNPLDLRDSRGYSKLLLCGDTLALDRIKRPMYTVSMIRQAVNIPNKIQAPGYIYVYLRLLMAACHGHRGLVKLQTPVHRGKG